MAMFKLPLQTALPENDKLERITQPQNATCEHLLSNHIGGLAIDTQLDNRTLPSIHHLLNNYQTTERRLSEVTIPQLSSGSSTPVYSQHPATPTYEHDHSATRQRHQVSGHEHPYPTSHTSPVQHKRQSSFVSRRSPQHWRYAESSSSIDHPSARSRESSEEPNTKKTKPKKTRNKKAQREYCGRQELSGYMAGLQNILWEGSPNLSTLAAPRPEVPNGGWRPLKSNNINKDLKNPLVVNKTDVLTSSITTHQHSNLLFKQVDGYLRQIGQHGFADKLAHSVAFRGCGEFRPLEMAE